MYRVRKRDRGTLLTDPSGARVLMEPDMVAADTELRALKEHGMVQYGDPILLLQLEPVHLTHLQL